MKKIFLSLMSLIIAYSSFSQSFDDVPVSGSLTSVVNKFKSKGYTLSTVNELGAIMKGDFMYRPIEIMIITTPISKQVYRYSVYLSKIETWDMLLNDYRKIYKSFVSKYGEPTAEIEKFDYPYELGDGYEMTAVTAEKCQYLAIWLDVYPINMMVSISEYKQVKITYENPKLKDVRDREQNEINKQIF